MNDIEKLEERIAQLTELVMTGTETIESLKKTLKTVKEERNRLAEKQEPKFERVKENESYYFIDSNICGSFYINSDTEEGHPVDEELYNTNNYFYTKQRAQEVVNKFNFLLRLERLHDIYCPDYVPDWDNYNEGKATVFYHHSKKQYVVQAFSFMRIPTGVYFPTSEIAQKVCDILNAELEGKE